MPAGVLLLLLILILTLTSTLSLTLTLAQERADAALLWVQRNAFTAGDNSGLQEALDPTQLRKLTARVWSSAALFEGTEHWPCSLLQAWLGLGFGSGSGKG